MTEKAGRIRRIWEWLWRGQRLRELRARRVSRDARPALDEAKSCQTVAWRALSGLEPIPSSSRAVVARPLIVAGLERCLPLTGAGLDSIEALFADATWQEHLVKGGLTAEALPSIHDWLSGKAPVATAGASEGALRALGAVLEAIEGPAQAINGVFWRRATLLLALVGSLIGITAGVMVLLTPVEGPDLAANKPWQASSFYPGFPASGVKPAHAPEGAFFSTTNEEANPWWQVDLQKVQAIGGLTVVNRSDCCLERAHPLVVELSTDGKTWKEVARQTDLFRTWRPTFAASKAQFVRLRALRRTHLHLKDVRVHPPRDGK